MNLYGAFAFFVILAGAALIVAITPPAALAVSVRESVIAIMGDQVLLEAQRAMAAARSRTDISPSQKKLLQLAGGVAGGGLALILLFFVEKVGYALGFGGLVSVLGVLWPVVVWKGRVTRRVAAGVYRDVPDLVAFLRLNTGEGRSLMEVLDAYVSDSRPEAILAREIGHVLDLAKGGASLFDQFEQAAARFPDNALLQVAVALRQVEEATDPQQVLQSLYEIIRAIRIAERKKDIKARVMLSIVIGVLFLMPALMAVILVPTMVTFSNLWQ